MDYLSLTQMQKNQSAWRLLQADNAPLIISFCQHIFIDENRRSVPQAELEELLENHLYQIRLKHGNDLHPRSSKDYLDEWSKNDKAFLRKYYPRQADEAEFDLTPNAERATRFLQSLEQRQFVGTESHLQSVMLQLKDLVMMTESDPQLKVEELEREKADIDRKIAALQEDDLAHYDDTQVKERWYLLEDTMQRLISDFRQVEQNFRDLDKRVREKISLSELGKGELLDEIFGDHDHIFDSDQGKSFKAFWALLVSNQQQQQLDDWICKIAQIDIDSPGIQRDLIAKFQARLLEAGEKVHRISLSLAEQLRLYLDDKVWLENKRIVQLIQKIERHALAFANPETQSYKYQELPKAVDKETPFIEFEGQRATISLPLSRSLFRPENQVQISSQAMTAGVANFEADALYNQHYVDGAVLQGQIRQALQHQPQISLLQISQMFPIEKGLSEVLYYLNLASNSKNALINDTQMQDIEWKNSQGKVQIVTLPLVIFSRALLDASSDA
jgi:hypothetical protein